MLFHLCDQTYCHTYRYCAGYCICLICWMLDWPVNMRGVDFSCNINTHLCMIRRMLDWPVSAWGLLTSVATLTHSYAWYEECWKNAGLACVNMRSVDFSCNINTLLCFKWRMLKEYGLACVSMRSVDYSCNINALLLLFKRMVITCSKTSLGLEVMQHAERAALFRSNFVTVFMIVNAIFMCK